MNFESKPLIKTPVDRPESHEKATFITWQMDMERIVRKLSDVYNFTRISGDEDLPVLRLWPKQDNELATIVLNFKEAKMIPSQSTIIKNKSGQVVFSVELYPNGTKDWDLTRNYFKAVKQRVDSYRSK